MNETLRGRGSVEWDSMAMKVFNSLIIEKQKRSTPFRCRGLLFFRQRFEFIEFLANNLLFFSRRGINRLK